MSLTVDRRKTIFTLALPIIGGMVSQNILNLIDTAMVGHLGDDALAAVGVSGFVVFMATAFITGLSAGVQAMSSRRLGQGRENETAIPLNGGLLLAIAMAIPLTGLMYALVPTLFPYLVDDPNVQKVGTPYMQIRMLAIAAVGSNFVFRGYWNGVGLSKLYMRTLVLMHLTNVTLNYLLIFGKFGFPEMGADGAAIGTVISLYVGFLYYIFLSFKYAKAGGFARGLPDRETVLTMIRLSIPNGIQNFFFAAGLTTFFVLVGKLGTAELAASQVLVNLLLVALLPGIGFGLAAASLVGQSLGKENPDGAFDWGVDVSKMAMITALIMGLPAIVYPDMFLMIFLHSEETLAMARWPLRLIGMTIWFDIGGLVLMNALLGAGDSRTVMLVSIVLQWGVNLPLIYVVGPLMGGNLFMVWCVQCGYRGIQTLTFVWLWRRGKWRQIEV